LPFWLIGAAALLMGLQFKEGGREGGREGGIRLGNGRLGLVSGESPVQTGREAGTTN
jgi:hypothetical protein